MLFWALKSNFRFNALFKRSDGVCLQTVIHRVLLLKRNLIGLWAAVAKIELFIVFIFAIREIDGDGLDSSAGEVCEQVEDVVGDGNDLL